MSVKAESSNEPIKSHIGMEMSEPDSTTVPPGPGKQGSHASIKDSSENTSNESTPRRKSLESTPKDDTIPTPAKDEEQSREEHTKIRTTKWSELNTAEMVNTFQDPSQELFSRGVAALLDSRKINTTHSAFDHLILIAEEYLCGLIEQLKKAARIQRRTSPSISDVLILLRLSGLHVSQLDEECEKEQAMPTILPQEWTDIELSMLPTVEQDSTELFLTQRGSDVASLIPSRKQRGAHIPNWMPPFPPDHTFMTTPSLPERVTDPRALREMIVKEGQMAEHALRRLTGVIEVDENAAHDDDDEAVAEHSKNDAAVNNPKIKNEQALASAPTANNATASDANGHMSSTNPLPRPVLALKLSLGASNGSSDSSSTTTTHTENGGTTDVPASPKSTADIKPDPFDLNPSTTRKFDVVEYVHKRLKLVHKWQARDAAALERARSQGLRRTWQTDLMHGVSHVDPEEIATMQQEDKDVNGLGAAISLVEHEYTAALAKIQKSKDDEAKKESIVDTGIVNWERDRYTWA